MMKGVHEGRTKSSKAEKETVIKRLAVPSLTFELEQQLKQLEAAYAPYRTKQKSQNGDSKA